MTVEVGNFGGSFKWGADNVLSGGDTGIRFIIPQNEHLRAIRFSVGKISSYKSLSSHKRKKDSRWIAILIVEFTVVRRPAGA